MLENLRCMMYHSNSETDSVGCFFIWLVYKAEFGLLVINVELKLGPT